MIYAWILFPARLTEYCTVSCCVLCARVCVGACVNTFVLHNKVPYILGLWQISIYAGGLKHGVHTGADQQLQHHWSAMWADKKDRNQTKGIKQTQEKEEKNSNTFITFLLFLSYTWRWRVDCVWVESFPPGRRTGCWWWQPHSPTAPRFPAQTSALCHPRNKDTEIQNKKERHSETTWIITLFLTRSAWPGVSQVSALLLEDAEIQWSPWDFSLFAYYSSLMWHCDIIIKVAVICG